MGYSAKLVLLHNQICIANSFSICYILVYKRTFPRKFILNKITYGGYSMFPTDTKPTLDVLDQLIFKNPEYPKTAAIYAAICIEVRRLWSESQDKALKIIQACEAAEKYCVKVIWDDKDILDSKPEKDGEIAGYLLAFTREPLKRKRLIFASQSWKNVEAAALKTGVLPVAANIDIYLDQVWKKVIGPRFFVDYKCAGASYSTTFPEFLAGTAVAGIGNIKNFEGHFQGDSMNFNVVGCQGVSELNALERLGFNNMQQEVAKQMNENKAKFNILLGDNMYNHGVKSWGETRGFLANFHAIYSKFSFVILGNHDYGIGGSIPSLNRGNLQPWNRAAAQVNHTSIANNNWYMPHRYYVIVCKHAIFYCIDSSTYVFDPDQQKWLKGTKEFLHEQYRDRWHILCSHHPLESYGKRGRGDAKNRGDEFLRTKEEEQGGEGTAISPQASPPTPRSETMVYSGSFNASQSSSVSSASVDPEEELSNIDEYAAYLCPQTCKVCPKGQSISTTIREQLVKDQVNFDVVFAAHDHFFAAGMLLDDNFFTYQVVVGCGGKRLQSVKFKKIVTEAQNGYSSTDIATFEEYGFLQVEINAKEMHCDGINHKGQIFYRNTILLEDFR